MKKLSPAQKEIVDDMVWDGVPLVVTPKTAWCWNYPVSISTVRALHSLGLLREVKNAQVYEIDKDALKEAE